MTRRAYLTFLTMALLNASPTWAEVRVVLPDGSGPYPTIQSAIDASVSGDVVELGNGVFTGDGNRDLDVGGRAIVIRSAGGDPYTCLIDCEGSYPYEHRGFVFRNGEGPETTLTGFSIRDAYTHTGHLPEGSGGAILCVGASPTLYSMRFVENNADYGSAVCCASFSEPLIDGCFFDSNYARRGQLYIGRSDPVVRGCTFENNFAFSGSAIFCSGGSPVVINCLFQSNFGNTAGAVWCHLYGSPMFDSCRFLDNNCAAGNGGAISVTYAAVVTVGQSIFARNSGSRGGAVSVEAGGIAFISNSTFVENNAAYGGAFWAGENALVVPLNAVVAFSTLGGAADCSSDGSITPSCSDFFGNVGGDWTGCVAGWYGQEGNIAEDPIFCDRPAMDFRLRSDSPCAGENNGECGQIGALGVGCEPPTPTHATTWGQVKAAFR